MQTKRLVHFFTFPVGYCHCPRADKSHDAHHFSRAKARAHFALGWERLGFGEPIRLENSGWGQTRWPCGRCRFQVFPTSFRFLRGHFIRWLSRVTAQCGHGGPTMMAAWEMGHSTLSAIPFPCRSSPTPSWLRREEIIPWLCLPMAVSWRGARTMKGSWDWKHDLNQQTCASGQFYERHCRRRRHKFFFGVDAGRKRLGMGDEQCGAVGFGQHHFAAFAG